MDYKFSTKIGTWIVFFFFTLLANAQEVQTTDSQLKEVTVFNYGANMKHLTPNTKIPSGNSELVIHQISKQLNPESIRLLSSNKNIKIQSVSFERDYISNTENKSSSYLTLKNKYNQEKELLIAKNTELKSEESTLSLLESNKNIGGNNGITPNSLTAMLTYYREEYKKISNNILRLKKEENAQRKVVTQLEKQLAEMGGENSNAGQLVIRLYSEKEATTTFEIEYYTPSVSWNPSYEVQVNHLNQPIQLVYNANLSQQTGIDWEQIKLRFSSGLPQLDNNLPYLSPWRLVYSRPIAPPPPALTKLENNTRMFGYRLNEENFDMEDKEVAVEYSQLQTSFVIETPYDIFTNKKAIAIQLQTYALPADYTYYSVPSKQEGAFLVAKISDWEKYNLLPRQTQLIIDGVYAGKSYINPNTTSDTLQISLGKDQRIITKRTRIDEEGSRSFLGNTQRRSFTYEIELRNTRSEAAKIEVKELFPISTEKDITVKLDQTSGAIIDNEKGELTWHIELKPNETQKLKIEYSVSFPKGKNISGL